MISYEKYKSLFHDYASRYDKSDGRVELKIIHTEAVVSIMDKICEQRHLPEHTRALSFLCAQFHDIGRFEQLKQFNTFLDHISVNHAALSCSILEENKILDELPENDKRKILVAIENHNKLEIDSSVFSAIKDARDPQTLEDARECLELCRLIRDADKCDIFRVFAMEDMNDVIGVPEESLVSETISPAVLCAIREHRSVDKTIRKTHLDYWISFLGYFFDMNYPESIEIARSQGYYRMPFERTAFTNPETKAQIAEVFTVLEDYMNHFSGIRGVPKILFDFFKCHPSLALAFSGGTDSAYLLYAATACGCDIHAYYVSTPFQPAFELSDARCLADSLNARMTVLPFNVLENKTVKKNPEDRCYHCKNEIFNHILKAAASDGYKEIVDGTNASDDAGDRPGMRALKELNILSPLRECGITKKALRAYSRDAGLFTWNKPAYACLATRIPCGIEIQSEILQNVEWAESQLSSMGFEDFRVRVFPDPSGNAGTFAARLQIAGHQLPLLMERRAEVFSLLKERFGSVLLDLETRASSL